MIKANNKNFYIFLLDASAFIVFYTLWDVNTVIPVFLDLFGVPAWGIGVATAIKQLGFLIPQLIMAVKIYNFQSLSLVIRFIMSLGRPQLLTFLIILMFFSSKKVSVIAFFICFTLFSIGEGFVNVPWMELFNRTVPPDKRGRLWGMVEILAGIVGLGTGYIVSAVIENHAFPFPLNFSIIFGLGISIILPSIHFFKYAEESIVSNRSFSANWRHRMSVCLNNKDFTLLLITRFLTSADALALPYYIVMVRHTFIWLAPATGQYVFLNIFGGVLGGIIWGLMSDKQGNRKTIVSVALLKVLTSILFLASLFCPIKVFVPYILAIGFFLAGFAAGGWLGFINYTFDLAQNNDSSFYIALNNASLLPTALLPILGGLIRQTYGDTQLNLITSLLLLVAFLIALKLNEIPRNTRCK